jgi:hypothetical protein
MSNSKASTFAETMSFGVELRMHVTFTRAASGAPRHHDRQHVLARVSERGRCAWREGENL